MSAVAWTHWDEAFELAGKCSSSEPGGDKRITFTLTPPLFERALVSLASDHGWLPKSDPRYQEACMTGRLNWWDGRGRCVVLIREGSWAQKDAQRFEAMQRAIEAEVPRATGFVSMDLGSKPSWSPDPYAGEPLVPDPVVAGGFLPKSIADEVRREQFEKAVTEKLKDAEDKAIAAEFVGPPAPPPGDPSLPPETGKATFAKALEVLAPRGKGKKK